MNEIINYFLESENGKYKLTEMQYYYLRQSLFKLKLNYERIEKIDFSRLLINGREVMLSNISIKLGKGVIVKILSNLENEL